MALFRDSEKVKDKSMDEYRTNELKLAKKRKLCQEISQFIGLPDSATWENNKCSLTPEPNIIDANAGLDHPHVRISMSLSNIRKFAKDHNIPLFREFNYEDAYVSDEKTRPQYNLEYFLYYNGAYIFASTEFFDDSDRKK